MDFATLTLAPLPALATIALDASETTAERLSAYEGLRARLNDIPSAWLSYSRHERETINLTMALNANDMAARGFIPA